MPKEEQRPGVVRGGGSWRGSKRGGQRGLRVGVGAHLCIRPARYTDVWAIVKSPLFTE